MASPVQQSSELLNSWKEISNYIGRGVRTVQRWERDFGLPVRRPGGHVRGSVIANKKELDAWLTTRSIRPSDDPALSELSAPGSGCRECATLRAKVEELQSRIASLQESNLELSEKLAGSAAQPRYTPDEPAVVPALGSKGRNSTTECEAQAS